MIPDSDQISSFERLYMNKMQQRATIVDPNVLICEIARAAGKTEGVFEPRMIRVATDMPGELSFLISKTYKSLLSNIIPNLLASFSRPIGPEGRPMLEQGKHYILGETNLPKHFNKPKYPISYPKHSLVFFTGHHFQLVASDQPESIAGRSAVHAFIEEMKHNSGEKVKTRIFPGLRGAKGKTRQSPYYQGITGVSDTARVDMGEDDWFFEYENNVDEQLISDIVNTALHLNKFMVQKVRGEDKLRSERDPEARTRLRKKIKVATRKIEFWNPILRQERQAASYYIRASTFVNKDILGVKFFKTMLTQLSEDEIKAAICNIRLKQVKDMFFGGFNKKIHTFEDSYIYDSIMNFDLKETFTLTANYLKYYNPDLPLLIGYDPGHFSSIVVAQENKRTNELRTIKEFYCWHPKEQGELAMQFSAFFGRYQKNRKIVLYADRAGNKKKVEQEKITTDSRLLKKELESYDFRVDLKTEKQRTIFYYEHFKLLRTLLSEELKSTTRIRVCANECPCLTSAIHLTPVKREDGKIEMDKRSERTVALEYQASITPQLPSALTYLVFGLLSNQLPKEMQKSTYFPDGMTA